MTATHATSELSEELRGASSSPPRTVFSALVALTATACGLLSPDAPLEPTWHTLGLDGKSVTALANTPWGLYAGTGSSGVFRYDGTAQAWQPTGLAAEGVINDLLYVPTTPPRLLAAVAPRQFNDSLSAVVFASADGSTWVPSDGGYAEVAGQRAAAFSFLQDPRSPRRVYVGLSGAIMHSSDGGGTWRFVFGNAGSEGVIPRIRADSNRTVWFVARGVRTGSLFYTLNAGSTWHARWVFGTGPHQTHLSDAVVTPDGRSWLVITHTAWEMSPYSVVFLSHDTGQTVERASTSGQGDMVGSAIAFATAADTLYALAQQKGNLLAVYRLRPGRTSWDAVTVPPDPGGALSAAFDDQGRLLVGTAGTGVWRMEW